MLDAPMVDAAGNNPRQGAISLLLSRYVGQGPADFFASACRLMADPEPFPAASHLVAHALREIESAIRDVLEPIVLSSAVEPSRSGGDGHRQVVLSILSGLNVAEDHPVALKWLGFTGSGSLAGQAHRNNLDGAPRVDTEFRQVFEDMTMILEWAVERLEANYGRVFDAIDELLAGQPGPAALSALRQRIPQAFVPQSYFFEHLDSSDWIRPLLEAGYFSHPPDPQSSGTDSHFLQMPHWPVSRYLARVAARDPQAAVDAALSIPATGNAAVNLNVVQVALAVPGELSVLLLPRVVAHIDSPSGAWMARHIGNLVSHLVAEGHTDEALDFARVLLRFSEPSRTDEAPWFPREPVPVIGDAGFRSILETELPRLASAAGIPTVEVLCELLDQAIRSTAAPEMIIAGADHSTSWRRAIERGDHDFNPGTRDAIASAIRDALATAVSVGADAIDLVAVLRRYSWSIFRRLVLHLARSEAIADEYVSQLLIDSDAISDRSLDFERRRLAHDRFRSLTGPQQQDYLGVIEQGPDLEPYEAWSIARQGRQMLADERRSVVEEWQRDELTFIADHLPTDWRVRYDGIVARVGEPSVFVLDPHPQVSVGAPSPFAMEELQAMSIEELVATVAEWHPQLGYRGTLAYQLTPLVSGSSDAFSARAMDLAVLPAEHLAAVVRGFGAALQEGTPLQWDQLLLLAANIAERVENDEQEWRWVKQEVLRLLIAAVGKQPPALGLVRRNDVFSVVARCGLDGDPSPETEEQLAGNGDLARTSVRGLSIEAMVQYGTWVRRFDPEDALSELFEFFEQHLDPAVDPSPTVRTMYGRWLANLCWLDASWVADQLGSLFPHDPEHRNLWLGVWTGFLWPSAQWTTLDRLLLDEFEFARSLMDSASTDRNQNGRDAQLLALVQRLVYQGVIEASHPLVDATFSGASEKAKRETLTMIGHQLRQQATTLDDAVRDRLMSLWERRETAIEAGAPAHELRAFCAWFASGRFPPEWALAKLEHALRQAGSSEGVHLVVERLAALVEELPGPVLRCLELLVEEGNEPWFFETWEEPARVVLSASLVAEDETLHRLAAGIINKATARGNLAWRDLLHDEREG